MRARVKEGLRRRLRRRAGGAVGSLGVHVRFPEAFRPGNRIEPLFGGGEAFPAMLEEIAAARRRVHLEIYTWYDDQTGKRFAQVLRERARAGVRVRVLYDSIGSYGLTEDFLAPLRADGVRLIEFHPIAPWRPRWGLNRRNHKKLLVVDDGVAFIGGINIGDVYAPLEHGGGGWFDVHSRCVGPVVADLARSFRRTWIEAGGDAFEPAKPAPPPEPGAESEPRAGSLARVIDNYRMGERSRMRAAYLFAIRNAGARISLMNPYFIPDRGLRKAFRLAVRRRVEVRIIVPAHSDVRVVQLASRYLYPRLLRGGVRIFEWTGHMMHAKTAVIDSVWSTIGSYNIDKRSFLHNLEASLVVLDRDCALRLEERFDADLERCREVSLRECLERPLWERVLQWVCYRFRYWM